MKGRIAAVSTPLLLLLSLSIAGAHDGGSSGYASLAVDGLEVRYTLTLWPRPFGAPVAGELEQVRAANAAATRRWIDLVREKVRVAAAGVPCTAGEGRAELTKPATETVTFVVSFTCRGEPHDLHLRDDLFDVLGQDHHTFVRIDSPGHTRQVLLTPDGRDARIALGSKQGVIAFVGLGVEHILTGYDHLLFLGALLLGGGSALHLLKIVTAFTAGHSVSLVAAVVKLVALPAWLVESVIAGSIAWVAIENTLHDCPIRRRWLTALGFGLVHGLGFASALAPLDLPPWNLAGALLGFNVGVEAGQALVIALVAPAIVWLGAGDAGRRVCRALSATVAVVGCVWLAVRIVSQ